ncbi:hypothetical protein IQ251_08305 [Saccharopolyspora sp. HNM0983]|uniref:Uncharacterized protein n=1 Tax=Saccharopolyspora montiporae TaxID=2781240 RepID=A0A929FZD4_9PSEU|nr:hypothetical protein [Saccharopolyspora sp. HNM0983]MBE9374450.1 hypothetical protein [Saccharopolyspora sp. HNM0983]
MDLFVLMFIVGFALAALIFWPLLHRANRRLADRETIAGRANTNPPAQRRPSTGGPKHAAPVTPAAETGSAEQAARAGAPAVAGIDEDTQPDLQPVLPQQRTNEPIQIPILPTDLFEKHFEAKFNRSRQRLARLRAELENE